MLCIPHFCVYICIVPIIIMCNVIGLKVCVNWTMIIYEDTCKCIFCLGAPACLNVSLFFQENKWWWWWWWDSFSITISSHLQNRQYFTLWNVWHGFELIYNVSCKKRAALSRTIILVFLSGFLDRCHACDFIARNFYRATLSRDKIASLGIFLNQHHFRPAGQVWSKSHGWSLSMLTKVAHNQFDRTRCRKSSVTVILNCRYHCHTEDMG